MKEVSGVWGSGLLSSSYGERVFWCLGVHLVSGFNCIMVHHGVEYFFTLGILLCFSFRLSEARWGESVAGFWRRYGLRDPALLGCCEGGLWELVFVGY